MHIPQIKELIKPVHNRGQELLVWAATTLVSGLVVILSVSPEYLRELNPFTLLLLSVTCSLPVWAINQLLWRQISSKVTTELVQKIVFITDISERHRRELSFALTQLFKMFDLVRFIPYRTIANLVTVVAIYTGAAVYYFIDGSPPVLYGIILSFSLLVWLIGQTVLHRVSRKLDVQPLRDLWVRVKDDDLLGEELHKQIKRLEDLLVSLQPLTRKGGTGNDSRETTNV